MELIEIYIQEVTRRLPEKIREDIALELRSTIADMLPDNYQEADVKKVLEKLGSPVALANGYRDRPMHLIGPRYYDIYVTLLKMIFPIAIIVSLISLIAEYMIGYSGEKAVLPVVLDIIGIGIWRLFEMAIQVFFWLTAVFALIERMDNGKEQQPLTASLKKWTPDDLKHISYIPKNKAITKFEVFGALLWTAIWATLYFYANQLVGVYEGNGERLEFVIPALNQEVLLHYWILVVIVIGSEIALSLYKLIKGQWTNRIAIANTLLQVFATIVFLLIVLNPNVINSDFITYLMDLFHITAGKVKAWIVCIGIIGFIVSAAISVYDGFRKAKKS
ncbi:hypothetical protein OEV98_03395 [Caldibacillus lycopersici]|uniref:Uncharacterized protein n=1 Tax=Perspicuibacillus lycopersici TaxID=1325689 RepID=A0AAE3IQB6_9BACI|nr:hypothetical protein [Perspicuibacillus lycopersici]MCU9612608.1 hypothetical protein [Perspicuibacillus lycopersici]